VSAGYVRRVGHTNLTTHASQYVQARLALQDDVLG
jgi:hypothetical protein